MSYRGFVGARLFLDVQVVRHQHVLVDPLPAESCGPAAVSPFAVMGRRPSRYGIQARDVWFVIAGPGGCHRDW